MTSAAVGDTGSGRGRTPRPSAVIALAVGAAVAVNLLIFAVGRVAGGTFRFTSAGRAAEVDAVTVAGFSALPLAAGLVLVALLGRRWRWVTPVALTVGPALAGLTILVMTIPADLDLASTVALALCHLTLIPVIVVAVRALRG